MWRGPAKDRNVVTLLHSWGGELCRSIHSWVTSLHVWCLQVAVLLWPTSLPGEDLNSFPFRSVQSLAYIKWKLLFPEGLLKRWGFYLSAPGLEIRHHFSHFHPLSWVESLHGTKANLKHLTLHPGWYKATQSRDLRIRAADHSARRPAGASQEYQVHGGHRTVRFHC